MLYAEKDIAIERNWHHNGLPTGEYTDALLPLDTAVSFGETTVKDGKGIALFLFDSRERGYYYHRIFQRERACLRLFAVHGYR